jgi:aminoglycoside phosphotransferase (APT) family kinase protein
MTDIIDGARAVRPGEELDIERLRAHLEAHLPGMAPGVPIEVEQFPGGHSNLTYLLRAGDREYVLRRPPHGSRVQTAHDMGREHRVLSHLAPVYPRAPRPLLFCDDPAVLGSPFYIMERVRGVILRRDPPPGLNIDPATATRLSQVLVDTLAELHAVDYEAAGLGDFGKPAGYVARQVTGWTTRYVGAQTDDLPVVDQVARWLADHMPPDGAPALIHNDLKLDNLVLDPGDITRVLGILDWEMSTVGDPLMDLGTTLCYWVEPGDPPLLQHIRFGPSTLPGMLTRAGLAERYAERSGRSIDHIVFYYCFGLFKTAVVAQQIYYRFQQGLTRDERFARMILGVRGLSEHARAVIERGAI